MGQGSCLRRRCRRVQLHDNRKLTAIRWIGLISVGEMNIMSNQRDILVRSKADKGAEKSFKPRGSRGKRIGKCRRVKAKREKVNLAAVADIRPQAKKTC